MKIETRKNHCEICGDTEVLSVVKCHGGNTVTVCEDCLGDLEAPDEKTIVECPKCSGRPMPKRS